jgi:hypothetical protein
MALDQIWKQQLTLVTYGNEYLNQDLSFSRWLNHAIFDQHSFLFRDLISQHLLAQHFQIWLEGLKKQGVQRLSLHNASSLNDEQNPNANVELLAFPHFIVSHAQNKKTAWILGKELPEWYTSDNDYSAPQKQSINLRQAIFWRYELNSKLAKRIEADFNQPNWEEIKAFMNNELFESKYAAGFTNPLNLSEPYYGVDESSSSFSEENTLSTNSDRLALLPTDYQADYAHSTLHRLDALATFTQQKIQQPFNEDGTVLTPDEQLNLRHFSQKLDDLSAKFITKIANHYKTARLQPLEIPNNPLEETTYSKVSNFKSEPTQTEQQKSGKSGVFTLIIITVIICLLGYYFGL